MRATSIVALSVVVLSFLTAGVYAQQRDTVDVGNFIGLPIIGDDNSAVADVADVLVGYDGQIAALIANLSGREREDERVRVPWSDVSVRQDPLQVKLTEKSGEFVPYPGPPAGTLGDINAALVSVLVGAPAKSKLGESVGDVVGISASQGRVVGVTISRGGDQVPLPWSFVEVRAERPLTAVAAEVDPVVVVDRRD